MLQGVIFDMDGLMFDTEAIWAEMWSVSLGKYGYEVCQGFRDDSLGVGYEDQLRIIRSYYGEDADCAGIMELETKLVEEAMQHEVPKKPGLDEILAWIAEHSLPCAVASGSEMPVIEHCLNITGVADQIDAVVSSWAIPNGKPAPDVFLMAAEAIGVDPAHTLVLEDSVAGVQAGRAGGFITVWIPDLLSPTPEISAIADATCENLYEVVEMLESGRLG